LNVLFLVSLYEARKQLKLESTDLNQSTNRDSLRHGQTGWRVHRAIKQSNKN